MKETASKSSRRLLLAGRQLLLCRILCAVAQLGIGFQLVSAQDTKSPITEFSGTLNEVKAAGAMRSSVKSHQPTSDNTTTPQPRVAQFHQEIRPLLKQACVSCHGPEDQEGGFRVDILDPNLVHGDDVDWWLDVVDVISNGEMPPEGETPLADNDRSKIVNWLSSEIQLASQLRRSEQGHSSFRRMTRYEYNYALQDLLGLQYEFAQDLPPETASEDGFTNSVEVLQMSSMQFDYYRSLSRAALRKAIVQGDRPAPLYWCISMDKAAAKLWRSHDKKVEKLKKQFEGDPDALQNALKKNEIKYVVKSNVARFKDMSTGNAVKTQWSYRGASYAVSPSTQRQEMPKTLDHVALIPAMQRLVIEVGDQLPDSGNLRVRIRACRTSVVEQRAPSLRLAFGHQASNNSSAEEMVSESVDILALPDAPLFYQWDIPLSEIVRNPLRGVAKMGDTPNPSEYIKLFNTSTSPSEIQIDYVEIISQAYDQWPPESHKRILFDSPNQPSNGNGSEREHAREVIERFITRAWRRRATEAEIGQKLALFTEVRSACDSFEEAITEVLATVLSSPNFLYLTSISNQSRADGGRKESELATRLSMFLWCSTPDEELMALAASGKLKNRNTLLSQTKRMLADPRSERFARQFVRGWLGMELLDYLKVDKKTYPRFGQTLKEAMQEEPIAFFREVLQNNHSVMDFLHADYAMVNEALANHYEIRGVYGNQFRRVDLNVEGQSQREKRFGAQRGGLLTQAGLLAMNSDGKDSHPLKRGIWMLERLLNDPPPPPPPAVPEIDLADPAIAKMTLKERIEDHRNDPACISCHAKIDPWGIAFEHFDAVGKWRETIDGKPVDATSQLFNKQKLVGVDGLKRFLLMNRQDQFARAMTHKLMTFGLGRPLTFGDRAEVDRITFQLRKQGDGLADLILLIVSSDLFAE